MRKIDPLRGSILGDLFVVKGLPWGLKLKIDRMIQLRLFQPHIIKHVELVSPDSPRQAFYTLWIETLRGKYTVRKESGGMGKVLDRRSWLFSSLEDAERYFNRRIKEKTDPDRRSPRRYHTVYKRHYEYNRTKTNDTVILK
jgi:hypothetical protein